jgi:hypothetical protein
MRCGVFYWPAGDADLVVDIVKKLWIRGLKLIVVTYCQSPDEQARVYDRIHEVCVSKRGSKWNG